MLLLVDDEYSVFILSCLSYMILTLVWTSPISNVAPANLDDFRLICKKVSFCLLQRMR